MSEAYPNFDEYIRKKKQTETKTIIPEE